MNFSCIAVAKTVQYLVEVPAQNQLGIRRNGTPTQMMPCLKLPESLRCQVAALSSPPEEVAVLEDWPLAVWAKRSMGLPMKLSVKQTVAATMDCSLSLKLLPMYSPWTPSSEQEEEAVFELQLPFRIQNDSPAS